MDSSYFGFVEAFCHGVLQQPTASPASAQLALQVRSLLLRVASARRVLAMQQQRQHVRMVINQAARPGDGRAITSQLQQVLDRFVSTQSGRPVRLIHMGDIPADPSVRDAVMRRQLLLVNTPGCPAALAISQLANKIETALLTPAA